MNSKCIFIAAGGTGGHIYPALAIAEAFREQRPDWKIWFVGTPSGLENRLVPAHGFDILHVKVGRLNQVSKKEKIMTLLKMPLSLFSSIRLLRKYKPEAVIGVGGFASGPILLMASLLGIRTAIWEPNAMPGLTNRWLSYVVDECWLVFESARKHLHAKKFFPAGMPVRREIEQLVVGASHDGPLNLLAFGGSQGARALNTNLAEMLTSKDSFAKEHAVVHQTGPSDYQRVKELYGPASSELSIEVLEYLYDMDRRYAWADVVIARAGAASVAELAACGKAAILIPLPTAADNHQQKNAEALVNANAAIMILQKDLTPGKLRATLQELEAQPERRHQMEQNIRRFHQPQAAEKIVGHLLQRIDSPAN